MADRRVLNSQGLNFLAAGSLEEEAEEKMVLLECHFANIYIINSPEVVTLNPH